MNNNAPRTATIEDMPLLLEVGQKFHKAGAIQIPLCMESLEQTLLGMLHMEDATIIVCGKSVAGAILVPSWMNKGHKTGQELFWWSDDGNGARLMEALEDWASNQGAASFVMLTLDELRPEAVGRVYRRRGYKPLERSFLKVF